MDLKVVPRVFCTNGFIFCLKNIDFLWSHPALRSINPPKEILGTPLSIYFHSAIKALTDEGLYRRFRQL